MNGLMLVLFVLLALGLRVARMLVLEGRAPSALSVQCCRVLTVTRYSKGGLAYESLAPRDPTPGLYSACGVLHTAADVRTGGPEHQHPRHRQHKTPYPKLKTHRGGRERWRTQSISRF